MTQVRVRADFDRGGGKGFDRGNFNRPSKNLGLLINLAQIAME